MSGGVLVVDDNPDNLKLLLRYLGAKGFEVAGVRSTGEAEQAIDRSTPAIVLVDVSLPGDDGLSWVRRVRDRTPGCRFVALTAHASEEIRLRALEAGCVHFFTKPLRLRDLHAFLAGQLGLPG